MRTQARLGPLVLNSLLVSYAAQESRGTAHEGNFPPAHKKKHTSEPFSQMFSVFSKLITADNWEKTFLGNAPCCEHLKIPPTFPPPIHTQAIFQAHLLQEAFPLLVLPHISCHCIALSDFLDLRLDALSGHLFCKMLIEF